MTEKRFTVPIKYRFSHSKVQLNGKPLTNDELVRILNTNDGAFVENFTLKKENNQLKSDLTIIMEQSRKNDEFLRSDIRILEKALWCSSCENDFKRLKELRKEFLE